MADEAFALSPIAAHAAQPSEADFDAIREAFMETARGRWFLGEYAKRNRNADTRMVLDAVARIEETLAAQRQPLDPQPEPEPDHRLPEALVAIRGAVDEAAKAVSEAIDGLGLEESLAPIRKGARIIKEISWRWREIGADSRICDLIDSQLLAIEASCGQISERDPRTAVLGAFDLIKTSLDGFSAEAEAKGDHQNDEKAVPPAADEVMETAAPAAMDPVASAALAETAAEPDESATEMVEFTAAEPDLAAEMSLTEAVSAVEIADEATVDEAAVAVLADDEADEAVLDIVALEMAAPDPDLEDDIFFAETGHDEVPEPIGAPKDIVVEAPKPATETMQSAAPAPQIPLPPAPQPSFEPPPQPSIGSAFLANGFLEQHRAPASDPLGPIRRMTQAEKIAFFS